MSPFLILIGFPDALYVTAMICQIVLMMRVLKSDQYWHAALLLIKLSKIINLNPLRTETEIIVSLFRVFSHYIVTIFFMTFLKVWQLMPSVMLINM